MNDTNEAKEVKEISPERERVDGLKNGLEQKDRFDSFKKKIAECSEIDLFIIIDQVGYMIWRIEHDLAKGSINYPEWDKNDKFVLQAEIELAVAESARFGVTPFVEETTHPTEMYFRWYQWWKNYIDGMPQSEWEKVAEEIRSGKDYSNYRPTGDWK